MKETAKTGSSIRKQIEKCLQKNKENRSNAEIMENILSDFTDSYQTVGLKIKFNLKNFII